MFGIVDYGWLNIGSLVLGLVAWSIPVSSLLNKVKKEENIALKSMISLVACAIALWFQLAYNNHLVQIQDWGALDDTTSTLNWVAAILLVVTIVLNIVLISREKIKLAAH